MQLSHISGLFDHFQEQDAKERRGFFFSASADAMEFWPKHASHIRANFEVHNTVHTETSRHFMSGFEWILNSVGFFSEFVISLFTKPFGKNVNENPHFEFSNLYLDIVGQK